jgi:hypothetical protein
MIIQNYSVFLLQNNNCLMYIMSSTRNRNTIGDYKSHKQSSMSPCNNAMYIHSPYGIAQQTYFPGTGLIGARIPRSELSANSCDIETQLFGIGSCDLENPRPIMPLSQSSWASSTSILTPQFTPQITPLKSLNICDRVMMIMPNSIEINIQDQKPLWLN